MALLAVSEHDWDGWDRYNRMAFDGALLPEFAAVSAAGRGDRAAFADRLREIRAAGDRPAASAEWVASHTEDFEAVDSLLALVLLPEPTSERNRINGLVAQSRIAAGRGRWVEARQAASEMELLDPVTAGRVRGMLASIPFGPIPREEMESIRGELVRAVEASEVPAASNLQAALQPHMYLFLLGMVEARLGLEGEALRRAEELEGRPRPPEGDSVTEQMASILRAHVAWARGRPEEALELLGPTAAVVPPELVEAFVFSGVPGRYLRAELLVDADPREALAWMDTAFQGAPSAVVYLHHLHLLRARALERMGRAEEARQEYARFLRDFEGADPSLEPLLDEAGQRFRAADAGSG